MNQQDPLPLLLALIAGIILLLYASSCTAPTAKTHHDYKNLRGDPCTMDCTVKCRPTPRP